jgi:putative NADH-flavin reductase
MNLVVFGSTGRVGRLLVAGALERGHAVTAFARDPTALDDGDEPRLCVIGGDVLDRVAVGRAVAGQRAVLYAVAPDNARARTTAVSQGMLHVVRAMTEHAVPRLVCLSAGGTSTERDPNLPWVFDRLLKPLLLKGAFADLRQMEVTVRQSGLQWTIVRPPRLLDGAGRGVWRSGPGYSLPHGTRIARADVAAFMLDELETDRDVGHAVAVAW